jgi:hypothetical protein
MKRIAIIVCLLFLLPIRAVPYFNVTGPAGWYETSMNQISCELEMLGLFHRITFTFQLELLPHCYWYTDNCSGDVILDWNFGLTEDAVITGCWMKPRGASEFIEAQISDLTSAEEKYESHPNARPRLLLRQRITRGWSGESNRNYEMRIDPVQVSPQKSPVIKIQYIAPCQPFYEARRLWLPLGDFSVTYPCDLSLSYLDPDNVNEQIKPLNGYSGSVDWSKSGGFHKTTLYYSYGPPYYRSYSNVLWAGASESRDRSYLRIVEEQSWRFYQLSIAPPIKPEDRKPKNILLAVDLSDRTGYQSSALEAFKKAVGISASPLDSISMIYSGFTPVVFDTLFRPVTPTQISSMFTSMKNPPVLNTLPHLLRQAVDLFNRRDREGEIWLITDAYNHSNPPQSAMEIVGQTVQNLKRPVAFRILSINSGGEYLYINGQYYYGNDYLYEILARLSRGSFVSLNNYPSYSYLDAALDCFAPTAAVVEIDPEPQGGLSYSRFDLNRGRSDFPIGIPYYEIGIFDGNVPFNVHYFGTLDGNLFSKDVPIQRAAEDPGWKITADYWYSLYIKNLLLEPQSHETVIYIENISVSRRILTPYSGFVISGQDGVLAFKPLDNNSEILSTVETSNFSDVPKKFNFSAFPNPFNDATTLSLQFSQLGSGQKVEIRIFNTLGQVIRTWTMPMGTVASNLEVRWDSKDELGQSVPSGVYLVVLRAGQILKNIKITLLK